MVVPVAGCSLRTAPDLHKPSASLDQSPSQQAATSKVFSHRFVQTVGLVSRFAFSGNIKCFRSRQLHAGGQFVRLDAGIEQRILRSFFSVPGVQLSQQFEAIAVGGVCRELVLLPSKQIGDWILSRRVDYRSLIHGGKKARRERSLLVVRQPLRVRQHDKGRQFVSQVSKSVRNPGPH